MNREETTVLADPLLVIDRGSSRSDSNRQRHHHHDWTEHDQTQRRDNEIEGPLGDHQHAAFSEAAREDEPARSQVFDGDLSGVLLVERREVIEADAFVQPHLEQSIHREHAARVGEADHHAIDSVLLDDGGNVAD